MHLNWVLLKLAKPAKTLTVPCSLTLKINLNVLQLMIQDSNTLTNCQLINRWLETGFPLEDLAEDVVFVIPGSLDNPIFGKFSGLEEVKRFFELLIGKLVDKNITQTIKVTDCLAQANRVIVLLEETFILENDLSQSYVNSAAWLFELNDQQKITYLYCYDNTLISSKVLT